MAPVRVSVITETYVPDVNGVANSLRQLIGQLDPKEYLVQLIRTRPRSEWKPEIEEVWCKGITIPMYPDLQIGMPARNQILAAWDRFQPEIVFIATEGPLGSSGLKLARERNIPVVSAFHTNFHRYSTYYGLGWVKTLTLNLLRRFHNRTEATLVPSEEVAQSLRESNFHNVHVLPHGVDCDLFNPKRRSIQLRNSWGASSDDKVMLYVGRIAAEKNIPLAIEAYRELKARHSGLKLVMVGDGPMREQMEKEHSDIIFAGVQTGEVLARYFASCDLFVFPSMTETFGLVTLEAMASGLPVAAYDMAAAHMHVEPGKQGELATVGDEQAFIRAVERLVSTELDGMRIDARTKAQELSWGTVSKLFIAHLNQHMDSYQKAHRQTERNLV